MWPDVEADGSHPTQTPGKNSNAKDKMALLAKVFFNELGTLILPSFLFYLKTLRLHCGLSEVLWGLWVSLGSCLRFSRLLGAIGI